MILKERMTEQLKDEILAIDGSLREETGWPTMEYDIDWDTLYQLDMMRILDVYTYRDKGELKGFAWVVSTPPLKFKGVAWKYIDTIYVVPEAGSIKKGMFFMNVVKMIEADNPRAISAGVAPESQAGRILESLGFAKAEINYFKEVH